nr:hypothetical protein [Fodinicola feengrottensis]
MTDDPLLTSLRAAVAAAPDDVPLRLHLAGLLADREPAAALAECSQVLQREPGNAEAIALLGGVSVALSGTTQPTPVTPEPVRPPESPSPPRRQTRRQLSNRMPSRRTLSDPMPSGRETGALLVAPNSTGRRLSRRSATSSSPPS